MGDLVYAHIPNLETESEAVELASFPEDLEYVFQLIRSSFLYISIVEGYFPMNHHEEKTSYDLLFCILSLPFQDKGKKAEVEQWNDLVKQVTEDFLQRKEKALRGRCFYEDLSRLIKDCWEDFDYADRKRLNVEKLSNLVVFVYDFCILTLTEANLHPRLDFYLMNNVVIRDKPYSVPLRICGSIKRYKPFFEEVVEGYQHQFENYHLPNVEIQSPLKNPHVSDSVLSAMFVDLMHKFFLSFGLQKKGNTEWAKAERMLIYELLRKFGFCKSKKPAEESKYVTTVLNDYGDYFRSCNLRTWIRSNQAYSYLMCCSMEEFVSKEQQINEPFIPLEAYIEVQSDRSTSSDNDLESNVALNSETEVKPSNLPKEFSRALKEIAGKTFKVTHTGYDRLAYASVTRKPNQETSIVPWDPSLDYVMALIESAFEYITFFPNDGKYLLFRQDLQALETQTWLVSSLEQDLLGRIDSIPRGNFQPDDVKNIISEFRGNIYPKKDRFRFDEEKFYVLTLFIYDFVFLSYKEATISPYVKKYIKSEISVAGESIRTTVLTDEMLLTYVSEPYMYSSIDDPSRNLQQLRAPDLFVPQRTLPIRMPSCSVKNMTAMFYDLYVHFFKGLGLTRRSDVKYVSDQENDLIGQLAKCCGICSTDNVSSIRRMFMTNQDYFKDSFLAVAIRENEYGYLMMNKMSDELFGPEWPIDDRDS